MDGSVLVNGRFTVGATVRGVYLPIPSSVDFIRLYNITKLGTLGDGTNFYGWEMTWQKGALPGFSTIKYYKSNGSTVISGDYINSGGFTLYDPSGNDPLALPLIGNAVATTASTNATRPVVSTASTAGISVGTVVRMSNTAQTDINGIDFVVGAVTLNTNFTLMAASNALATAPGAIGGAGFYRIINSLDPLFYPRKRYITNITRASNANVSTSVSHGLTPGQAIRFYIPDVSGMTQLNPGPQNNYSYATVLTVVDDYNITVNVDTTNYTAFTYPTIAQQPSQFPQLEPIGEDTAVSLVTAASQVPTSGGNRIYGTQSGLLADATTNTGFLGLYLGTGGFGNANTSDFITGPAGATTGDVISWIGGKMAYTYSGYL